MGFNSGFKGLNDPVLNVLKCVLVFTVFLYCFVYVYLFLFVTSVTTTATERKLDCSK